MNRNNTYTEIELLEIYAKKARELGRLPKVIEINNDPAMPSYATYLRRLGGKKQLYRKLGFQLDPRKLKSRLCLDCLHDPRYCGMDYDDCVREADLYFRMLER